MEIFNEFMGEAPEGFEGLEYIFGGTLTLIIIVFIMKLLFSFVRFLR